VAGYGRGVLRLVASAVVAIISDAIGLLVAAALAVTVADTLLLRTDADLLLRPVVVGTELAVVQAGIPAVIPTEACYLGWQESLQLLALLVEAEIPG